MATDCEHSKVTVTTDSGEDICPICDDVELETLDEIEVRKGGDE